MFNTTWSSLVSRKGSRARAQLSKRNTRSAAAKVAHNRQADAGRASRLERVEPCVVGALVVDAQPMHAAALSQLKPLVPFVCDERAAVAQPLGTHGARQLTLERGVVGQRGEASVFKAAHHSHWLLCTCTTILYSYCIHAVYTEQCS